MSSKKVGKKEQRRGVAKANQALALLDAYAVPFPSMLENVGDPLRDFKINVFTKVSSEFLAPLHRDRSLTSLNEGYLAAADTLARLLERMPETIDFTDVGRRTIACEAGCNHCCTLRVTCPAASALCIAKYLKKKLNEEESVALLVRLKEFDDRVSAMSPLEQSLRTVRCPINVEGLCQAYHVRPLVCQGYHSFDLGRCIDRRDDPGKGTPVPMDPRRIEFRNLVIVAMTSALGTYGLNVEELEFVPALRIALEVPDAAERYLAGEDVFGPARRPDVQKAQKLNRAHRPGTVPLPMALG